MLSGMSYQTAFARLVFLLAGTAGIIGMIAGFRDRTWQLGAEGWLTLSVAGMAASIAILVDEQLQSRKAG